MEPEQNEEQPVGLLTIKQKKVVLATQFSDAVLDVVRQCMDKNMLVADTEWATLRNAVTLDAQSNLLKNIMELLEKIKEGDTSLL